MLYLVTPVLNAAAPNNAYSQGAYVSKPGRVFRTSPNQKVIYNNMIKGVISCQCKFTLKQHQRVEK